VAMFAARDAVPTSAPQRFMFKAARRVFVFRFFPDSGKELGQAKENPNPKFRYLSTNDFHIIGRHVIPVIVVEMSPQIIHDSSNLIVTHHRSEWRHSALSVDDNFDWISAGFETSVSRK
jgi:hypothetical protein